MITSKQTYAARRHAQVTEATQRLEDARASLETAQEEYEAAILAAVNVGLSNIKIGSILGSTEGMVRMKLKRQYGLVRRS